MGVIATASFMLDKDSADTGCCVFLGAVYELWKINYKPLWVGGSSLKSEILDGVRNIALFIIFGSGSIFYEHMLLL